MKKQEDTNTNQSTRFDRIFEILPGALTWLVLTSPIWLSFKLPVVMAFFILFLDVYWLHRVIKTVILGIIGYRRMEAATTEDWMKRLEEDFDGQWQELNHIFVIPSYRERGFVIETTLEAIAKLDYPLNKVRVILALEEREDEEIKQEKKAVAEKYKDKFANLYVTEHPDGLVGEVIGPGSNRTWSLKHLMPMLEKEIDVDKTILTTLDADFAVSRQLLTGLTHKYLSTERPKRKSFTGVFFYTNNYWQAPAPMRIITLSLMVGQLGELVENWKYTIFSSHSLNLRTLANMGFWTIDHVNDDSHLYWRAYYHFDGDFQVIPHWMPIHADTVLDETLTKTFINQYKQLQRWAYGVEHIPFIYKKFFQTRSIPLIKRLERVLFVTRANLFWATIALVTGFGTLILLFVNQTFQETVLGQNLAIYSSYILTAAILGLLPMAYYGKKLTPPMPKNWSRWQKLFGRLQFVVSPFVLMTFGTLPAIDSQTRLMLGKYLTYRVTRKHRE